MLFALEVKDILGPAVSVIFAAVSGYFLWTNYKYTTKEKAARDLFVEGQKLVLDIDRRLMDDPTLWGIYDDHPVRKTQEFIEAEKSPLFTAKLQAFAYLLLNTFEIVLSEAPEEKDETQDNWSNVWRKYFENTVTHSSIVRSILENSELHRGVLLKLLMKLMLPLRA